MAVARFGVFDFDVETQELRRQGRRVHLTGQAAMLGTHDTPEPSRRRRDPGRAEARAVVRCHVRRFRSQLASAYVTPAALRDAARSPRFVETLPRRGYRFIGDVVDVESVAAVPARPGLAVQRLALLDYRLAAGALVVMLATQHPAHPIAHSRTTALPEARAAFSRAIDEAHAAALVVAGASALKAAVRIRSSICRSPLRAGRLVSRPRTEA